jgi:hypothetical protein
LACPAGVPRSFRDGAEDILRRFGGVHLSAATTRRATPQAGRRLQRRQRGGELALPRPAIPWDFRVQDHRHTAAYLGLDAFSVPMQRPGGGRAEGRMPYTAIPYTPDKSHSRYPVDFDPDRLAAQMRRAAIALGLGAADPLIAIGDAGNGIEAASRRHFEDDLLCILGWYHASQHLHAFAAALRPQALGRRAARVEEAKGLLYEQGGEAFLSWLRSPAKPSAEAAADGSRELITYLADSRHRADDPEYRRHGWDLGSGPTEAACEVVGARSKRSGMRWLERGAAEVAPLRALYQSGSKAWDAFGALAG